MSELHPATKLLLARMESHPEEFADCHDIRWHDFVQEFRSFAGEKDRAALDQTLNRIRMDRLHEKIMDELLNGEERRAEEERKRHADAQRIHAMATQQQAQLQAAQRYAQANGLLGGTGIVTNTLGNESYLDMLRKKFGL